MKGIVFTEFLEMVADQFGDDMVDDIIDESELASGGSYTSVGTYPHDEIVELVGNLSRHVNLPAADLMHAYGVYLFARFVSGYPAFFEQASTCFDFLSNVHEHIHIEVRKLYPDAEHPVVLCRPGGSDTLMIQYRSERPFADFAAGLIEGCIKHFGEDIAVARNDNQAKPGYEAEFTLTRES